MTMTPSRVKRSAARTGVAVMAATLTLSSLPLPAQTTLAFAPALRWPELVGQHNDPLVVERCYREVEATMQRTLDGLERGRRVFLGQPEAQRATITV